jgi:hypothetical protein
MVGPEGYSTNNDAIIWNINQCKLLNSAPYGELLGRIGNGSIFPIGRSTLFFPADEGELFLSINDGYQCLGDNQGDIKIVIINR